MREPPVVFLALLIGTTAAAILLGEPSVPSALRLPGSAFIGFGILLHYRGWSTFRGRGTPLETLARPTELVTDGVYARTRNPMYLGGLAILAGWITLLGHPALHLVSIGWVPLSEALWIRPEERLLEVEYAEAWSDYRARVRRWI